MNSMHAVMTRELARRVYEEKCVKKKELGERECRKLKKLAGVRDQQ